MRSKILVIDDDSSIHTLIKAQFDPQRFEIISAHDGHAGMAMAAEQHPDVIVLDVALPTTQGFEICRQLKADRVTRSIPVIFLTGVFTIEATVFGLECGACDYLTKPFSPDELQARVRAALRGKSQLDRSLEHNIHDELTDMFDHKYFEMRLDTELAVARRSGRSLGCILLDIDDMALVNTWFGTDVGDDVLRKVGQAFLAIFRREDVACRLAGDEFGALISDATTTSMAELSERARTAVRGVTSIYKDRAVQVTASVGFALSRFSIGTSIVSETQDAARSSQDCRRDGDCVGRELAGVSTDCVIRFIEIRCSADSRLEMMRKLMRRLKMSKNVLIIDDSLPLHKLVKDYLAPDRLAVHSAYDGESGLVAAARLRPGLIILDVDMPRLDGFEVCRRLKSNPATASIPVIFLTADSMLDNRVKGLDVGASDYISKPFKPDELRARVRASLRARNQMESANLVDGPTGLWNHAYFSEHMDVHVSLARRFGSALSCAVIEVDPDSGSAKPAKLGAAAASDLLRTIAQVFTGRSRAEDLVCRLDTWKFAILATRADREAAAVVAERLRKEIERQLHARNGRDIRFTCNVGVADTLDADTATLLCRADAAVHRPRRAGLARLSITRRARDIVSAGA